MNELPNIKIKTLKEARQEMAKFGITAKVSTLRQAQRLLLACRAELAPAAKPSKPKQHPKIPAYPKEHQPPSKPHKPINSSVITDQQTREAVANAIAERRTTAALAKPATQVDGVMAFYNLEVRRLRGESVSAKETELAVKGNEDVKKIHGILTRAIQTLCKAGYQEGILLSRSHTILQEHPLTKDLDPRDMLKDITGAKAEKRSRDAERARIPSMR